MQTEFPWGNIRERDQVEDLDVDERVILKWIYKIWIGGMDWIDLTKNRDRRLALVKAVMNF